METARCQDQPDRVDGTKRSPDARTAALRVKPSLPVIVRPVGSLRCEPTPLRRVDTEPPRPCQGAPIRRQGQDGPPLLPETEGADGRNGNHDARIRRAMTDDEIRQHQEERQAKPEALHARFTEQVTELVEGDQWRAMLRVAPRRACQRSVATTLAWTCPRT
jgi:hypothetical protein